MSIRATTCKAPAYLDFELVPLLRSQAVRLGNNGNNVHNLAEFLHHDNINWAQSMACGVDEVQAAMDARILNVTVSHGRQFLAEVRAVLVLDVLDNRVPAAEKNAFKRNEYPTNGQVSKTDAPVLIVHLVPVPRRIDNVQPQLDAVFHDNYARRKSCYHYVFLKTEG